MAKQTYTAQVGGLIDQLDLSDLHKQALKTRWLQQVDQLEAKAQQAQKRYYSYRLITIVGSALVTGMLFFSAGTPTEPAEETGFRRWFPFGIAGLSLVVTLSSAVDGFCHFGANSRRYRQQADALKSEGWQFLQLSGPYQALNSYHGAYPYFASQIEGLLQDNKLVTPSLTVPTSPAAASQPPVDPSVSFVMDEAAGQLIPTISVEGEVAASRPEAPPGDPAAAFAEIAAAMAADGVPSVPGLDLPTIDAPPATASAAEDDTPVPEPAAATVTLTPDDGYEPTTRPDSPDAVAG